MTGTLFLIPGPLSEAPPERILAPETLALVGSLRYFIVENEKSARAWLRQFPLVTPIQELSLSKFDEHSKETDLARLLEPLLAGNPVGLLSEAGLPCIADPGAPIVRAAHQRGIKVRPLVGPSSLLLGLIASGLPGQSFQFLGYPPRDTDQCKRALRDAEQLSRNNNQSILFIETPYRSAALFKRILEECEGTTELCVAEGLTGSAEFVCTRPVSEWRTGSAPSFQNPAVFVLHTNAPTHRKGKR